MKKMYFNKSVLLLSSGLILCSGCSTIAKLQVHDATLADGRVIKIGTAQPTAKWKCQTIKEVAFARFSGRSIFDSDHSHLKKQALQYANEHHLNTNYIYLDIPGSMSVNGLDMNALKDGHASFYRCKQIKPEKINWQKSVNVSAGFK